VTASSGHHSRWGVGSRSFRNSPRVPFPKVAWYSGVVSPPFSLSPYLVLSSRLFKTYSPLESSSISVVGSEDAACILSFLFSILSIPSSSLQFAMFVIGVLLSTIKGVSLRWVLRPSIPHFSFLGSLVPEVRDVQTHGFCAGCESTALCVALRSPSCWARRAAKSSDAAFPLFLKAPF